MPAELFYLPFPTAFSSSGIPIPGAQATFYATGTATKLPIYSDATLTTERTNPVVADSIGRFPETYLDAAQTYRVVITGAAGQSLGIDVDPYFPGGTSAADSMFIQSGDEAVSRPSEDKLRERIAVDDYAGASDVAKLSAAITETQTNGRTLHATARTYNLGSSVTYGGAISWRAEPGAVFTGAGTIDTPDFAGYFSPDIRYVALAESRGSVAFPSGDIHPVAAFTKHTLAPHGGQTPVAALYAGGHKHSSGVADRVQGIFCEAVDHVGGEGSFIEGLRSHAVNPLDGGVLGDVYGIIAYAQSGNGLGTDPNNNYTIGVESETARCEGSDNVSPPTWTGANQMDANFLATSRTAGGKIGLGAFVVNPFNSIGVQAGFLVGNSLAATGVSSGIVNFASFCTLEDDVTYGLYVRGTGIYSCIRVPNNIPIIRASNAAGSAEDNILYYDTSHQVVIGADASGVVTIPPLRQRLTALVVPAVNGEMTVQATSDTQLTFKLRGSDGVVRSGNLAVA